MSAVSALLRRLACPLALLCVVTGAYAQDLLIRGAHVHTASTAGDIPGGDVLVRNGKIAAVGTGIAIPSGVQVVEAGGKPLTPGLFAGITAIGVEEVSLESGTVDEYLTLGAPAWQMQWRPEFDVTLAFNPRSVLLPVARIEGLTWAIVAPDSRNGGAILSGQGAAMTLDGRYDAVLDGSRSLFMQFGADAVNLSAGSRAAQYMLFDQAAREARSPPAAGAQAMLLPAGREVLARYLDGGRFVFDVHRAADIRQVLALAKRHSIRPVIVGASEAWLVAGELAAARVPVLLDPLENLPATFDRIGARFDNAALLAKAGVAVAFALSSDSTQNARKIRQLAGNAVAHGLPWDVALAGLTSTPADIFGVARSRGRIAVGQVADLVLWSGDPLEVTSVAEQVWTAGTPVVMRSRQTELRDRYLERLRGGED
ncbi:MAG TPA: amidohydrolase family protein [Steroidobacteraceae bacterium]|nr:amidohydrolase family protein [Steroidobacteraceae bacterium]